MAVTLVVRDVPHITRPDYFITRRYCLTCCHFFREAACPRETLQTVELSWT